MSSSSKTTENSKTVSTPTNPAYVESLFSGLAGQIQGLSGQDPLKFVAGSNPLLQLAGDNAMRMNSVGGNDYAAYVNANPDLAAAAKTMGMSPWEYGQFHWENFGQNEGRQMTTVADPWAKAEAAWDSLSPASASFVSGLDHLDGWMNPYRREVVDTALRDYDLEAGRKRAEAERLLNGADAFSGSGGALSWLGLEDGLNRGRSSMEADLLSGMFDRSAGYALTDAGNENQVNMFNAGQANQVNTAKAAGLTQMTGARQQDRLASTGLLGDLGVINRDIAQQQAAAPLSLLALQSQMAGSLPWDLFRGGVQEGTSTSTTKSSNPMGTLGSLAMLAAAPFTGGTSLGLGGLFGGMGAAGSALGAAGGLGSLGSLVGGLNPAVAGMGLLGGR